MHKSTIYNNLLCRQNSGKFISYQDVDIIEKNY